MILVTGGAGFVGSNFILQWVTEEKRKAVNLDKLTHAGNLNNLSQLEHNNGYYFVKGDIRNRTLVQDLLNKYRPNALINFAAETQKDRSSHHPEQLVQTNILGTFELLEAALSYWKHLSAEEQSLFRFLHVSVDEVYGNLQPNTSASEKNPYAPNGTFAASKASADHLVSAYQQTYGLPTLIAHSVKNFGPYQFPDKTIPSTVVSALQGKPLVIAGDGLHTQSWLYVGDHSAALRLILTKGTPGETYNISDEIEISHLQLIRSICQIMDELKSDSPYKPHASLIKLVKEKSGLSSRFSLNCSKIRELGWKPKEPFEANLRKTISWYLHNMSWVENVISGEYRDWISTQYPETDVISSPSHIKR